MHFSVCNSFIQYVLYVVQFWISILFQILQFAFGIIETITLHYILRYILCFLLNASLPKKDQIIVLINPLICVKYKNAPYLKEEREFSPNHTLPPVCTEGLNSLHY